MVSAVLDKLCVHLMHYFIPVVFRVSLRKDGGRVYHQSSRVVVYGGLETNFETHKVNLRLMNFMSRS